MTERLGLNDTVRDATMKLSEGNLGALRVCCDILAQGDTIDPDAAFGSAHTLFFLDTLGIYGSRIWMFYKDVCGQDLVNMLGMLRAVQLGFVADDALNSAIDNYGAGVDLPASLAQVREYLPNFAAGQPVTSTDK